MNNSKGKKSPHLNTRKVLFVCNGNVFRSFSAETLLRHYLDRHKMKGWEVFSAGTRKKEQNVDPEVIARLRAFGIKNLRHRHHKLSKPMLKKFDLVVAMAEDQIDFMKKKFNYEHAVLFNELVEDEEVSIWDIEDDVKDYMTNRIGAEREIDRTVRYIHDNIPRLIHGIDQRVYLFVDFANGLRKHNNGYPVIRLYETPHTVAFMSISIPSKEDGHILVIPKKRYIYFHEIPSKVLNELLRSVQKIGAVLDRDHGGYNVLLNNGRAAGQYIFHAHFHIFPRDARDKIDLNGWSRKRMTLGQFVEFNDKLKEKLVGV